MQVASVCPARSLEKGHRLESSVITPWNTIWGERSSASTLAAMSGRVRNMHVSTTTTTRPTKRYKSNLRIKFKDRYDYLCGRYFFFTFANGIFYLVGAGLGYSRSKNLFCLFISGFLGICSILLSLGHGIDYYRKVDIEAFYVSLPCVVSLFVAILMSCLWGLGTSFHSAYIVAIGAWIAVVVYLYALAKDYSDGGFRRTNDFDKQYNLWTREDEIQSRNLL